MKKVFVGLLTVLIAMSSITAFAASVPSRTTQDLASVVSYASDSGVELDADFIIRLLAETDLADSALAQLADFVANQNLAPIRFFDEAIRRDVATLLPEGTDLDKFVILEFSPLIVENYREPYGDVTATFQFATPYEDGTSMVALIGLVTGTDEQGNPVVQWTPIHAEAADGFVKAHFPGALLLQLDRADAMIAILSETQAA
jgi:hypothetical protein